MNNSKLIVGALLMVAQFSSAQNGSFTLEAAKTYAQDHHVSIKNADHDITGAKERANEVRAIGLPQVNITGTFGQNLHLPVQVMDASFFNPGAPPGSLVSFRAGTKFSSSAGLQANQMIFNGSYIIGLKAAAYFAKFQETASDITKEDVSYNVIQAYQLTSVAKENLSFVDSMVITAESMVEMQAIYFDLGLLLKEDMDQLKYSVLTAKQAQVASNLQYQNSLNLLKFMMGYPMEDPIAITQTPDELIAKSASGGGDVHTNLSYSLIEKQIILSELNLQNNKLLGVPTLGAYYQHSYTAYRNEFDFFDSDQQWFLQNGWGLQLNVPVFSGGQSKALIGQAKVRLMKDENSLIQLESALKMQEIQAKNNLLGAQSKIDLQKQNVDLAKSIYENSVIKDQIGEGTSMAVTQKHNQLIMAQSQYVAAKIDLFQAQLELDKIYNNILDK
ncbi:MAG: TolC family protein [Crocinitomicaceae bacterium]|nr:TolC family protein [Crocinitomicaceae bacterium]